MLYSGDFSVKNHNMKPCCLTTISVNFLVLRSEKIDSLSTPGDHLEVKVGVKLERGKNGILRDPGVGHGGYYQTHVRGAPLEEQRIWV